VAGETLNNYAMSVKSDGMQLENELVARNVRRFRRERAMSLGELARRSGLSKQTLSKIEQGCGNPTVDTLAQLGAALDLPARRLFTERGTPVYVKRHYEGSWVDGAERSERILDETYGSGYVRTLTLKLERVDGEPRVIGAHSAGTLHHLYVISGRVWQARSPSRWTCQPVTSSASPATPHLIACRSERASRTWSPRCRRYANSARP
jgi:transcriptional regulator with XRE-family HTH domain